MSDDTLSHYADANGVRHFSYLGGETAYNRDRVTLCETTADGTVCMCGAYASATLAPTRAEPVTCLACVVHPRAAQARARAVTP